jgi:hypothetical protein
LEYKPSARAVCIRRPERKQYCRGCNGRDDRYDELRAAAQRLHVAADLPATVVELMRGRMFWLLIDHD